MKFLSLYNLTRPPTPLKLALFVNMDAPLEATLCCSRSFTWTFDACFIQQCFIHNFSPFVYFTITVPQSET